MHATELLSERTFSPICEVLYINLGFKITRNEANMVLEEACDNIIKVLLYDNLAERNVPLTYRSVTICKSGVILFMVALITTWEIFNNHMGDLKSTISLHTN